jgi:hypothetical protein
MLCTERNALEISEKHQMKGVRANRLGIETETLRS